MRESFEWDGVVAEAERRPAYRIVGEGIAVVELRENEELLTEPGCLLYRRGPVRWSLVSGGRNLLGRVLNQAMRQAAGVAKEMHRYEGPGELGLAAAVYGRLTSLHLKLGDNVVVDRRCLVAATSGVVVDVAYSRRVGRGGKAGRVMLMRVTGTGLALVQAHGSSTELRLEDGEELETRPGAVVCFDATAEYELHRPRKQRLMLGSREGEWLAMLTGPGRVMLQSATLRAP